MNSRQPWSIAVGHLDTSNSTIAPGDAEYLKNMETAALAGDPYAQWHLAIAYDHGTGDKSDEEIREMFKSSFEGFNKISKSNDREVNSMIASFFEDVTRNTENWSPVEKNLNVAINLIRYSAEAGFAPAQNRLATAYYLGEGVEKDEKIGVEWSIKAASQGDAEMQESLGAHYCSGFGCDEPMKAIKWYEMAAKQGHRQAQRRLAKMYADEKQYLIHDPIKALTWYEKCAMLGDEDCLGEMWWAYKLGIGTIVNPYNAYVWLLVDKAATTDEPYMYAYNKEEFEGQLSTSRLAEAQSEAEKILKTIQENKKGYPYFF